MIQVVEGVLFIRCPACRRKHSLGGEDPALVLDHRCKRVREFSVDAACEIGVATQLIGEDVDAQAGKLRDKHERVACHVMVSFILMTEPGDRQVEHRVEDRGTRPPEVVSGGTDFLTMSPFGRRLKIGGAALSLRRWERSVDWDVREIDRVPPRDASLSGDQPAGSARGIPLR